MQKARLARIHISKINARNAFIANKRKVEQRLLVMAVSDMASSHPALPCAPPWTDGSAADDATETSTSGPGPAAAVSRFNTDDLFQLQHHHLLACLEKTTVGLFAAVYSLTIICDPPP